MEPNEATNTPAPRAEAELTPERLANRAKLYSKIAAVMADVEGVPERGRNTHHGYSYRTAADVSDAVRPVMARHGLVIIPNVEQVLLRGDRGSNCEVHMEYLICCAETGESVSARWLALGADTQDKGPFKAYTGATKYFLVNLFKIGEDSEDPDAGTAGDERQSNPEFRGNARPSPTPDRKGGGNVGGGARPPKDPAGGRPTPAQQENRDAARAKEAAARAAAEEKRRVEEQLMEEGVEDDNRRDEDPFEGAEAAEPAPARPAGKAGKVPQIPAPEPAPERRNTAAPHDGAIREEITARINRLVDPSLSLSPEEGANVAAAGRLAEQPEAALARLVKARDYLRTLFDTHGLEL